MSDESFTELAGDRVVLRRFRRQCEIGFTIASEHQGHGYATEAARLLVSAP